MNKTKPSATKPAAKKKAAAAKPAAKKEAAPRPRKPALPRPQRPPKAVTRDMFLVWRMPRTGVRNPHRLTNPAWAWLARHRDLTAYMANAHFDGPSSLTVGPCWCANRFGQSITELPDGRTIAVAGEHEDYYDPDFYIYNDVIVTAPSGEVEIFGYPYDVFPPTDFHSATLRGDTLFLLGNLGHPPQRIPGVTPAFTLDARTLAISRLATTGDNPGWIFEHDATLSDDQRSITVRGGQRAVEAGGAPELRDNHDDWSLDLDSLVWTRLTERRWPSWELCRADGQPSKLDQIDWMTFHVGRTSPFDVEQMKKLEADIGWVPDFALHASRYTPPFEHEKLPDGDGYPRVFRVSVDGVIVRYVEDLPHVRITVEGQLAPDKLAALVESARSRLEALERARYEARPLLG